MRPARRRTPAWRCGADARRASSASTRRSDQETQRLRGYSERNRISSQLSQIESAPEPPGRERTSRGTLLQYKHVPCLKKLDKETSIVGGQDKTPTGGARTERMQYYTERYSRSLCSASHLARIHRQSEMKADPVKSAKNRAPNIGSPATTAKISQPMP